MACGLPVIAGNKDGSVDALKNGELGLLVDPENETEILQALEKSLNYNRNLEDISFKKELQQKVYETFAFETFKQNLKRVLVPLTVMHGAVMLNLFQHL
jgi:glycosyltransferase involved in cell wall biosynthesis